MRKCDVCFLLFLSPVFLLSLPQDHQLMRGRATLERSGEMLTITASDQTILQWKDFSIAEGETTRFVLPSSQSSILNRVMEAYPSRLLGNLEANGQVLLVNSNGILVGKNARIDLGSFIASTLDISDSAFLSKEELCFAGESKAIVQNLGSINASDGDALLIGWNIDTQGVLNSVNGIAGAIAAGHVVIRPQGQDRIFIKPRSIGGIEENSYSGAFVHENEEDALSVEEENGFSHLVAKGFIGSKRDVGRGGNVLLMGDFIDAGELTIDASGLNGGGEIFIGGGEKGQNKSFVNAAHLYLDASVAINADALESGAGGKVILWADEHTHFLGNISARGGSLGGDGGFAEVSGKNYLDYQGFANLTAELGKTGTLLLDPTDIVIATAGAGVIPAAGNCSYCTAACMPCSVNCNAGCAPACVPPNVANCRTYSSNTALLNTTLSAALGGANVLLDATAGAGGAGTITVNPLAAITWASNNSLGLNACGNITIRADIQNSAAGNVSLQTQGGIVQIGVAGQGNIRTISVGSQNGLTLVCASNADLNLQGGLFGQGIAQIGFRTVGGETCNGAIIVNCRDLTMLTGTQIQQGIQIGHGNLSNTGFNQTLNTNGNITVNARNILMSNNGNNNSAVHIGHGSDVLVGGTLSGDIAVNASGTITLRTTGGNATFCTTIIGHSEGHSVVGVSNYNVNAAYHVVATGNISIQANGTSGTDSPYVGIGSASLNTIATINNPITVESAGTIDLEGVAAGTGSAFIGWSVGGGGSTIGGITKSDLLVSCCGLTINGKSSPRSGIGYLAPVAATSINGDVAVASGGNINLTSNGPTLTSCSASIGNSNPAPLAGSSNTFVMSTGTINISGTHLLGSVGIRGFGNVSVAANTNINVTGNGGPTTVAFIGPVGTGNDRTRVFAGGDIIASNSAGGSRAFIGRGDIAGTASTYSLDARAGGDIQISTPFTLNGAVVQPTSGIVFIEADTNLNVGGELWQSNGAQITSIACPGTAAICCTNSCTASPTCSPACVNALPPIPFNCVALGASSAAVPANNLGAITVNTAGLAPTFITYNTTGGGGTGNITLHSASTFHTLAGTPNLTIGNAAGQISIITTSGNIDISGSVCADAFNNLTIQNNVAAPWTSGSIYLRASNNLTINTTVQTSPGASSITLISDSDLNNAGNITLAANVTANTGNIFLNAGLALDGTCAPILNLAIPASASTASINQNAGTISTTGAGSITGQAALNYNLSAGAITAQTGAIQLSVGNDIGVNGLATSILTTTGAIELFAGNQIDINRIVQSTNGSISIISDANIDGAGNLNITANITTTSGNILLQAGDPLGCFSAFNTSSINQSAGLVSTATGNLDANANFDINISNIGAPTARITVGTGYFHALARHEINLTNAILSKTGAGVTGGTDFRMIAGLNINLINSQIIAPLSFVTLVVDNCFPAMPLIGPGAFNLDATSSIDPVNLRVFTALQSQNTISGTLNGAAFVPGTLFVDTATEHWCQYFAFPFAYPLPNLGVPYTIFYKNCLAAVANQAQVVVTQFLLDLHPFNEFPGWIEEFYLKFRGGENRSSSLAILPDEPYYFRRRHLQVINQPKSYTLITNDANL